MSDSPALGHGIPIGDSTQHLLHHALLRVEQLALTDRRKDEFLAMLGHELRSPLTSIRNAVGFLSSQADDGRTRQRAQELVERQVRRMTRLIDDLLDLSRIAHGRLRVQLERVDLRVVVRNAIETLEPSLRARNHQLNTALLDSPVWLQADPERLEQVFVNLLSNASRYTDAGGQLALWMHARDGQAVVRIRDSGIGIARDALGAIFDLFNQTEAAASRCKSGLGIGLALVRTLVELHGGSVTAASAGLGQGAEFTVRLPQQD
ncbi:MAG TPA: HAMP domain-containing sensor histidine kinase [Steroidobacteraceae bacterium]